MFQLSVTCCQVGFLLWWLLWREDVAAIWKNHGTHVLRCFGRSFGVPAWAIPGAGNWTKMTSSPSTSTPCRFARTGDVTWCIMMSCQGLHHEISRHIVPRHTKARILNGHIRLPQGNENDSWVWQNVVTSWLNCQEKGDPARKHFDTLSCSKHVYTLAETLHAPQLMPCLWYGLEFRAVPLCTPCEGWLIVLLVAGLVDVQWKRQAFHGQGDVQMGHRTRWFNTRPVQLDIFPT